MKQMTRLPIETTRMSIWLLLQLFLSHFIACSSALVLFLCIAHAGIDQLIRLIVPITAGTVIGLLFTSNIQYSLHVVELALVCLAEGRSTEPLNASWYWPLSSILVHIDVVNHRMAEYTRNEHLTAEFHQQLLHQTNEAAIQTERNRIARDLHDSVKQQLFSISVSAAAAKAHWEGNLPYAKKVIDDIQRCAKEAQVEMRALLQQLGSAPLEHMSLAEALRTQAQALELRIGGQAVIDIDELVINQRLLTSMQETIFRLVQEAFSNIARHARAHTIWLKMQQKDNILHITIRDDGQGFENGASQKGMGLKNLHERANSLNGHLEIQSVVGKGTTIYVSIPLLQALYTSREQEQKTLEIKRVVEQAKRGLHLGTNAATIAMILLIANFVFGAAAKVSSIDIGGIICTLLAAYGVLRTRYCIARIAIYTGKMNIETLSLQQREHGVRLWLLCLFTLCAWYFFLVQREWTFSITWWLTSTLSLLFVTLFIVECIWRYRTLNAYYKLLPALELRWEIIQKERTITRRWRLLLIVGGLLILAIIFRFPLTTPRGWGSFTGVIAISLSALISFIDFIQVKRWRHQSM